MTLVQEMFPNALKAPTIAKTKADNTVRIRIEEIETLAALDALIKGLTGVYKKLDTQIKNGPLTDYNVEKGRALGRKPENFIGFSDNASGSCQYKRKGDNITVSDADAVLLAEGGITVTTKTEQIGTLIVNPIYLNDQAKLKALQKATKDFPGFIMVQEAVTRKVLGEDAINEVFRTKTPEMTRLLLPLVGIMAINAKLENTEDLSNAFRLAEKALGRVKAAEKAEEAVKATAKAAEKAAKKAKKAAK